MPLFKASQLLAAKARRRKGVWGEPQRHKEGRSANPNMLSELPK
jgi:hypothetical protein